MTWLLVLLLGFALGLEYGRISAGKTSDWKRASLAAGIAVVIAVLLGLWVAGRERVPDGREPAASGSPVACTMEAKRCPDGSYVGRTGPRCEFAPCPAPR